MAGTRYAQFSGVAVLGRSFRVLWLNFVPFYLVAGIASLPSITHAIWADESAAFDDNHEFLGNFGAFLLSPIAVAVITLVVVAQVRGKAAGVRSLFGLGVASWGRALKVSIVVGIIVAIATLLLIVPGAIYWSMYFVAVPAAVVERLSISAALQRSAELTRGRRREVFVAAVVYLLFLLGVSALTVFLWPASFESWQTYRASLVVTELILIPVVVFGAVVPAVAYHELDVTRYAPDAESDTAAHAVAEVFE